LRKIEINEGEGKKRCKSYKLVLCNTRTKSFVRLSP
jgi:hypothetical protein